MSKRALLSVYDKTGIVEFARAIDALGYDIISTGGTLKLLKENGIEVTPVAEVTGFPECLDGRVKTLHPVIHAGILAMRDNPNHMATLAEQKIGSIDIVAINLYPFRETVSRPQHTLADAIENIDIGGPTMLRSAAKNHKDVTVIVDPSDYNRIVNQLKASTLTYNDRALLALKVFEHTAHYDAMISSYLRDALEGSEQYPQKLTLAFDYQQGMRYGENPHQSAAFYKDALVKSPGITSAQQLHGKQLSFNNINDAQAAIDMIMMFEAPTCVAVKHANPCGIGQADSIEQAYAKAYDCDSMSIFGGILAFNQTVTRTLADAVSKIFIEIIIAPDYDKDALDILTQKKNIRLLKMDVSPKQQVFDLKRVQDGILIQSPNDAYYDELTTVTNRQLTETEKKDVIFGIKAMKYLKSNGIAIVKNLQTVGLGPGQVSRIWAAEKAISQAGAKAVGGVLASDAYIPFNDVIDAAHQAGVKVIVQPGGSKNDDAAIKACDAHGMTMVFIGMRHFKH